MTRKRGCVFKGHRRCWVDQGGFWEKAEEVLWFGGGKKPRGGFAEGKLGKIFWTLEMTGTQNILNSLASDERKKKTRSWDQKTFKLVPAVRLR